MKTEIFLGIIGGICILCGCVLYTIHDKKDDDKIYGIISLIVTALGIAIFVGVTNTQHFSVTNEEIYYQSEDYEEENETINYEGELDP